MKSTSILRFKGMNEGDLWQADPEWATYVENMEYSPQGYWRTMPGALQVAGQDWEGGAGNIIALTWFQPRPNQRWLVFEEATSPRATRLAYVVWSTGQLVEIATRSRIPGRHSTSQFLQIGRWLYHFNGLDTPIRWDGRSVNDVGFVLRTPSPKVAGDQQGFEYSDTITADLEGSTINFVTPYQRGIGQVPEAGEDDIPYTVAYGLTVINDLGQESPMSSVVFASGTASNAAGTGVWVEGSLVLGVDDRVFGLRSIFVDIPVLMKEARAFRLWRSVDLAEAGAAGLPEMLLQGEYRSGGGCQIVDMTPDSELGPDLYDPGSHGYLPLNISCAAHHHDALWVAVDNYVFRSRAGFPEMFPPGQRWPVGASGAGHVVMMTSVPRGLAVLTTKGVFLVKVAPELPSGYRVESVDESVEVAGPRAAAYVPAIGLVVLTSTGPIVVKGTLDDDGPTRVVPLPGISRTWANEVNGRALGNSLVIHRTDAQEVWFHLPRMGDTKPDHGYVYHYANGGMGWSVRPFWGFSSATTYQGRLWLGSNVTGSEITSGIFLLCRSGVNLTASNTLNTPPDPATPLSLTVTETTPRDGATLKYWWRTTGNTPVVGVYESGVITSPASVSHRSVELLMVPTGVDLAMQVQQRFDREVHWRTVDDVRWLPLRHGQEPDEDRDAEHRGRWGEAVWTTDRMWSLTEPAFIRVPLLHDSRHGYQIRVRGFDVTVGGMRLQGTDASARTREPA